MADCFWSPLADVAPGPQVRGADDLDDGWAAETLGLQRARQELLAAARGAVLEVAVGAKGPCGTLQLWWPSSHPVGRPLCSHSQPRLPNNIYQPLPWVCVCVPCGSYGCSVEDGSNGHVGSDHRRKNSVFCCILLILGCFAVDAMGGSGIPKKKGDAWRGTTSNL